MKRWATRLGLLVLVCVLFFAGYRTAFYEAGSALVLHREDPEHNTYWVTLRPSRLGFHWGIKWDGDDSAPQMLLNIQRARMGNIFYAVYFEDGGNYVSNAAVSVRGSEDVDTVYVHYNDLREWNELPYSRQLTIRALDEDVHYIYEDATGTGELVLIERAEGGPWVTEE